MLTRCVNCRFYVRQADEFCFNCGKQHPTESIYKTPTLTLTFYPIFESKLFKLIVSLLITFILVYFIANEFIVRFPKFDGYIWLISLIFWILLSFVLLSFLNPLDFPIPTDEDSPVPHIIKNKNNLISKSKTIEKRIAELNHRSQRIDAVLDKIRETDGENLQEVRRKLLAAREIVISQFARYELQRQKIELVRLQNGVSPYLFSLHRLNDFETENGLATLENTHAEIFKIRQTLTSYVAIDFPARALSEKEYFLGQLTETENSCEKLREALLNRQAARALQDISPIEDNLRLPGASDIVHAAETFNIQTTLTDFSESFEELEREYKRIRAEEVTGQTLLET
jgi:energy-coupling factor transporter transmembrane protein EcfT